ncbi:MAG: DUF4382 domain-containing protein [Patescibacteria group bacterium]|nr:DUF4382 domain-containing protein [Patescibacteria group bacterium]
MDARKGNGLFILLVLGIGVIAGSIVIRQSLELRGHANLFNNINSAAKITVTTNPDDTMGPTTWKGNYSNQLPFNLLGTLDMQITDPVQGPRPTKTLPTQAQGKPTGAVGQVSNDKQPNSVTVSSLVITFRKVEIHMDYLGTPGGSSTRVPSLEPTYLHPSLSPTTGRLSSPSGTGITNKPADHWEVIEMNMPVTLDLVTLAATHDFAMLGLTRLAAGQYSEVRLYIDSATATLSDGTKITPVIPGHANIVRIVQRVTILAGKSTTISVDFDAQNSVIKSGNLYLLDPVVAHFNQTEPK